MLVIIIKDTDFIVIHKQRRQSHIYPGGARASPLFECGGGGSRMGTGLEQLNMLSGKLLAFFDEHSRNLTS